MTCDRCASADFPASAAFGVALCADCRSWLKTIALIAIQAERAAWAKPDALTDAVLEAIAAAQTADRHAVKQLARQRKFSTPQKLSGFETARYQRR